MTLPEDFFDEGVNYRIRLCMLLKDAVAVAPGSKLHPCDGCDSLIWVNESQPIPDPPDGIVVTGDVNLCNVCSAMVFAAVNDPSDIQNIDTVPPALRDMARKYFGLPPA